MKLKVEKSKNKDSRRMDIFVDTEFEQKAKKDINNLPITLVSQELDSISELKKFFQSSEVQKILKNTI